MIADTMNARLRRLDFKSGLIETLAGSGDMVFNGRPGKALETGMAWPNAPRIDRAGNVWFCATGNNRVLKLDAKTGQVLVAAGNGLNSYAGDGGPGPERAAQPAGVARRRRRGQRLHRGYAEPRAPAPRREDGDPDDCRGRRHTRFRGGRRPRREGAAQLPDRARPRRQGQPLRRRLHQRAHPEDRRRGGTVSRIAPGDSMKRVLVGVVVSALAPVALAQAPPLRRLGVRRFGRFPRLRRPRHAQDRDGPSRARPPARPRSSTGTSGISGGCTTSIATS